MFFYCSEDFKKNKSYRDLEKELCEFLFSENKTIDSFKGVGSNLNRNLQVPYIKYRLGGRGKYRMYFLAIVKEEKLFLLYVHPKFGSFGADNITDKYKTKLLADAVEMISSKNYFRVEKDSESDCIVFVEK